MAQGPRTELAATLEPGDDAVVRQLLGHRVGDVGRPVVGDLGRAQCRLEIVVAPLPAQVGAGEGRDVLTHPLGDVERAAERGAGVAGRRLHPDLVETRLGEDPAVGHAVEGDTPGQREVLGAGLRREPAR